MQWIATTRPWRHSSAICYPGGLTVMDSVVDGVNGSNDLEGASTVTVSSDGGFIFSCGLPIKLRRTAGTIGVASAVAAKGGRNTQ